MHTNTLFLYSMYNLYAFYTLNHYSQHIGSIHPAYSIYRCNTSDIWIGYKQSIYRTQAICISGRKRLFQAFLGDTFAFLELLVFLYRLINLLTMDFHL